MATDIENPFYSANFLPPKLNPLPLVRSDFQETLQRGSTGEYLYKLIERIFDMYRQSKDTADFLNLQGKLEPQVTLKSTSYHFNVHAPLHCMSIQLAKEQLLQILTLKTTIKSVNKARAYVCSRDLSRTYIWGRIQINGRVCAATGGEQLL